MIASSRSDFPAAERFFEAAMNAAPFNPDYYYSLAEMLRKDHRPKDAIARYDQAARRGQESEQTICRFKARMASLEAGDVDPVREELEQKRKLGPLSIDWKMTEAAIAIHQGDTAQAVKILEKRGKRTCRSWMRVLPLVRGIGFSQLPAQSNQELAQACRVNP